MWCPWGILKVATGAWSPQKYAAMGHSGRYIGKGILLKAGPCLTSHCHVWLLCLVCDIVTELTKVMKHWSLIAKFAQDATMVMSEPWYNENIAPTYTSCSLLLTSLMNRSSPTASVMRQRHQIFLIACIKPKAHCWETPTETRYHCIASGVMVAFLWKLPVISSPSPKKRTMLRLFKKNSDISIMLILSFTFHWTTWTTGIFGLILPNSPYTSLFFTLPAFPCWMF